MAPLGKLGDKLSKIGQDALKKTQKFADVTTIKSKLEDEKRILSSFYVQLGKLYFTTYKDAPHNDQLKNICESVQKSLEQIAEYEEQIHSLQGVVRCEECGASIDAGAAFCSGCGHKNPSQAIASAGGGESYCPACGGILEQGARFCPGCGSKL